MAFKKDKRQRVRILKCDQDYLVNMIGRVEKIDGDIYSVMIGPYIIDFNKNDIENVY